MRLAMFAAAVAAGFVLSVAEPVWAAEPSVSDMINALRVAPGATRGSRPIASQPGAPSEQAPAATAAIDLNVLFASGSAELTPAAVQTLDRLGQALTSSDLAGGKFRIEGHTDTTGTPEQNMTLSQRRASAVVGYLTSKFAIDPARLQAVGRGQEALLVPTGETVSEPRNRRVHVVNIGG